MKKSSKQNLPNLDSLMRKTFAGRDKNDTSSRQEKVENYLRSLNLDDLEISAEILETTKNKLLKNNSNNFEGKEKFKINLYDEDEDCVNIPKNADGNENKQDIAGLMNITDENMKLLQELKEMGNYLGNPPEQDEDNEDLLPTDFEDDEAFEKAILPKEKVKLTREDVELLELIEPGTSRRKKKELDDEKISDFVKEEVMKLRGDVNKTLINEFIGGVKKESWCKPKLIKKLKKFSKDFLDEEQVEAASGCDDFEALKSDESSDTSVYEMGDNYLEILMNASSAAEDVFNENFGKLLKDFSEKKKINKNEIRELFKSFSQDAENMDHMNDKLKETLEKQKQFAEAQIKKCKEIDEMLKSAEPLKDFRNLLNFDETQGRKKRGWKTPNWKGIDPKLVQMFEQYKTEFEESMKMENMPTSSMPEDGDYDSGMNIAGDEEIIDYEKQFQQNLKKVSSQLQLFAESISGKTKSKVKIENPNTDLIKDSFPDNFPQIKFPLESSDKEASFLSTLDDRSSDDSDEDSILFTDPNEDPLKIIGQELNKLMQQNPYKKNASKKVTPSKKGATKGKTRKQAAQPWR